MSEQILPWQLDSIQRTHTELWLGERWDVWVSMSSGRLQNLFICGPEAEGRKTPRHIEELGVWDLLPESVMTWNHDPSAGNTKVIMKKNGLFLQSSHSFPFDSLLLGSHSGSHEGRNHTRGQKHNHNILHCEISADTREEGSRDNNRDRNRRMGNWKSMTACGGNKKTEQVLWRMVMSILRNKKQESKSVRMNEQLQWSGKGKMSPGWNKREQLWSGKHHTDVSFSQFYEHNVLWPQTQLGSYLCNDLWRSFHRSFCT